MVVCSEPISLCYTIMYRGKDRLDENTPPSVPASLFDGLVPKNSEVAMGVWSAVLLVSGHHHSTSVLAARVLDFPP